jgi:hypothetical protein
MTDKLTNDVVRHHAELVADLLRLDNAHSQRSTEIRRMIRQLEEAYPELETRRITLMADGLQGE